MIEVSNKTRRKLTPRELLTFKRIAKEVLGEKFDLSLVICTDKISDHNVLAYKLSGTDGEIFLNPSQAKPYSLAYLFLHACVHLLGYAHGKKMDTREMSLARDLGIKKY